MFCKHTNLLSKPQNGLRADWLNYLNIEKKTSKRANLEVEDQVVNNSVKSRVLSSFRTMKIDFLWLSLTLPFCLDPNDSPTQILDSKVKITPTGLMRELQDEQSDVRLQEWTRGLEDIQREDSIEKLLQTIVSSLELPVPVNPALFGLRNLLNGFQVVVAEGDQKKANLLKKTISEIEGVKQGESEGFIKLLSCLVSTPLRVGHDKFILQYACLILSKSMLWLVSEAGKAQSFSLEEIGESLKDPVYQIEIFFIYNPTPF